MTSLFETLNSLSKKQPAAWEKFLKIGLPEKKAEAFRYVPLTDLYGHRFTLASDKANIKAECFLPEANGSCLVFVNGRFDPALSSYPKELVVLPLDEAMRTYSAFIKQREAKILSEEVNPFALVNMALAEEGLFVYLPPKTTLEHPIEVLHFVTGSDVAAFPRLHLFVGASSSLSWITHTVGIGEKSWSNALFDVALEENACLRCTTFSEGNLDWQFDAVRATLKKDSQFESISLFGQAKVARLDARVSLLGENGAATLQGLSFLEEKHQSHIHTHVEHAAPACRSMQKFKTVLKDVSRCSFEGKIYVKPIAQKTEAYQLNNTLLLSDLAQAYSKPNLEIFADDVKASHGATVTQLSDLELFYLKTRGISEALAKTLLVTGFCREVLDQIPYATIRERYHALQR